MIASLTFLYAVAPPVAGVTGKWRGVDVTDGQILQPYSNGLMTWDLDLLPDGTFKWHQALHVMTDMIADGGGKYTVEGSKVHLKGSAAASLDDGHGKWNETLPVNYDLVERAGELWMPVRTPAQPDFLMVVLFYRPGSQPHIPADMMPKPWVPEKSSSSARALAGRVEARYASLKTYRDEGTMRSNGYGWAPESMQFRTCFQRGKGLFYKSVAPQITEFPRRNEIWMRGSKVWLSSQGVPPQRQKSLDLALDGLPSDSGDGAEVVPRLLGGLHPLTAARQVVRKANVVYGGKKCAVLELSDSPNRATRLTIDLASLMIVRVQDSLTSEDYRFKPHVDGPVDAKSFAPPSSGH